ncbi:hypothetical protein BDK51DRAFT_47955 [Blyttiomyces helicus]|uniref:Ankyrin repeat-containing domain protein n=1 Tax=Blyttiomyces helicus TaxID=388810 RepID=A0A4P9WKU4_9FUNG|nr:hypothetical protein BDK51DRAFT_47955 [Blyttiomyces helicus]|eukprot:RKO92755.1 hypothetical protein BDK51DRAFT_47955 [Blyttiomyces helicus]
MQVVDRVVNHGHLDALTSCSFSAPEAAMDGAAAHGHLEVLKLLHYKRGNACTQLAMDKCGHSEKAVLGAICGGHLHILPFLRVYRRAEMAPAYVIIAEKNDNTHVADYIRTVLAEQAVALASELPSSRAS